MQSYFREFNSKAAQLAFEYAYERKNLGHNVRILQGNNRVRVAFSTGPVDPQGAIDVRTLPLKAA